MRCGRRVGRDSVGGLRIGRLALAGNFLKQKELREDDTFFWVCD